MTEERHAPGKFGQLSEDGLHVKDLAGDEEADSNGGKVDNPRGHLGQDYLHFEKPLKVFSILIFSSFAKKNCFNKTFIMTWDTDRKKRRRGLPSSPEIEMAMPNRTSILNLNFSLTFSQ